MQLPTKSGDGDGGVVGGVGERRKPNKRKSGQKSRLLSKAKKFGKQGRLGRGFEVDSATYNYFVHVLELWTKNEFASDEERETFVENSFAQTEGNEVNYSSNQMTSRVIEKILPSASEEVLLRFGAAFAPSLRTLCADPFASHVVEKLLELSSSDRWSKDSAKLGEWFRQTAKYVLNNFEEFTFDPYANHVMRKVCQCLTGFVQESGQAGPQQQNTGQRQKPGRKTEIVGPGGTVVFGERRRNRKNGATFADFYQNFLTWPQFFDLFGSELTSGFVQTLLKAAVRLEMDDPSLMEISVADGVKKVCKALGDDLDLTNATHANLYTRVLEVCLSVSDETWGHIFNRYFKGRLTIFGTHEKGKFALKKVIETCPSQEQFETIFDEIHPAFGELYKADATSPFVSVAEGCKKFGTRQSQFIKFLTGLFDGAEDNFIMSLARFGGKLELKEDGTPKYLTQFVGTMMVQNMMDFHKPSKIVSSMLEMEMNTLMQLTMDPKGSHIVDAYFNSGTIGEKNKEKMFNKFKEHMVTLALNKFGSRVINTIWCWGSMKYKAALAALLCDRLAQINGNQFGKFIAEKASLHVFKRDPKLWAESLEKGDKRKKEAEDVLAELLDDEIKVEKVEEDQDVDAISKKNKKKKKKDKVADLDEQEQVEEVALAGEEGQRKKKKNKKDKTAIEVPEEIEAEIDGISPSKSNKKKKNKRKHQQDDQDDEVQLPDSTTHDEDMEQNQTEQRKKKRKKDKKKATEDTE